MPAPTTSEAVVVGTLRFRHEGKAPATHICILFGLFGLTFFRDIDAQEFICRPAARELRAIYIEGNEV